MTHFACKKNFNVIELFTLHSVKSISENNVLLKDVTHFVKLNIKSELLYLQNYGLN